MTPKLKVHPLSLAAARIEAFHGDISLASATGFVFRHAGKIALVTNWHVASGRNTYTGQPLSKTGAVPNRFVVSGYSNKAQAVLNVTLTDFKFLQHPKGQSIDVAVFPWLDPSPIELSTIPLDAERTDFLVQPGLEAFVLGYPRGVAHRSFLPIWKRATLATDLPISGLDPPIVLVDTATREGMSGAPVFLSSSSFYRDMSGTLNCNGEENFQFLGIDSGRLPGEDEFAAQVGRVFLRSCIEQTIEAGIGFSFQLK